MFKTISVIGGDLRQLTAARLLKADGFDVSLFGFDDEICESSHAFDADVIILPLPVSFDGEFLNAPFSKEKYSINELTDKINPSSIVLGGRITGELCEKFDNRRIKYFDYLNREELAIKNAIPTAEGAIEIAMRETPITLHGSKCLVTGYGRIGKILSKMLYGLGARVSVEARKFADLALIEGHDFTAISLNELPHHIGEFDVIFNTVPHIIFDESILEKVKKDALIIDLASHPGGVDFAAAANLGVRVIWALSLPGKVAPVSAGAIIKDTIVNILNECK